MEMNLNTPRKGKTIALKSVNEEEGCSSLEKPVTDEDMALLTRQFRKILKFRKPGGNRNNFQSNTGFKNEKNTQQTEPRENRNSNSIRCYECGGNGHIAPECANTLKRKNQSKEKALKTAWSDSEDESTIDSENDENIVAFAAKSTDHIEIENEVEEIESEEELIEKYEKLFDVSYKIKKQSVFL
ncbi:unnamed protein product, partial [Prunus brigantina]